MKIARNLIVMGFLVTACSPHDAELIGTWKQEGSGTFTVAFAPDGTFVTRLGSVGFEGSWHLDHGVILFTNIMSNSVHVAEANRAKITLVTKHSLNYEANGSTYKFKR